MATFRVHGPFELPWESRKGGRTLVFDTFWQESSAASYLGDERGCYVLAFRAGRGLTPQYIGKATKTFRQETFNASNRHKYQNAFSEYGKCAPLMYFVVHPAQRGRTNSREIGLIEDFLIQAGFVRNPNLQNVKGIQQPSWGIKGVIRGPVGKRTSAEKEFIKLFGLQR